MAEDVSELLVKVRPEGIEETKAGLQDVDEQFESSADETGRAAGVIGDMAGRLKGFAGIVVGTLTTLAAGILTQVPVIQESASALGAVIDSIALRIDSQLRPSMSGLNQDIFRLADAIARGEGVLERWTQVLGDVLVLVGDQLPGIFGDAVTAVGEFLQHWDEAWASITQQVPVAMAEIEANLARGFISARQRIEMFFATTRTGFEVFFDQLINEAKRWVNGFVPNIAEGVNRAIGMLNKLPQFDIGTVSQSEVFETRSTAEIRRAGETRLRGRAAEINRRAGRDRQAVERQLAQTLQALQNTDQTTTLELDGREVARNQEQYTGAGAANVGRVNRSR